MDFDGTYSMPEHGMVAMTWSALFSREYVLNNFDVSRQLAERQEACLLRLLPCQRMRGGSHMRRNFCLQAVDVHQFIWCQIARSTTVVPPLLFNFRKRRRAKRKASHSGSNISRSTSFFILETTTREYWTVAAHQLNQKSKPTNELLLLVSVC